jgi:DNA-binding MarR family transcriptional regulator
LSEAGLVEFARNPHHRRAQLVVLTEKGQQTFEAAMRLQVPWVEGLAQGLSIKDIETAHQVMLALRQKVHDEESP